MIEIRIVSAFSVVIIMRKNERAFCGAGNILLDLVGGLMGAFTGKIVLS